MCVCVCCSYYKSAVNSSDLEHLGNYIIVQIVNTAGTVLSSSDCAHTGNCTAQNSVKGLWSLHLGSNNGIL